MNESAVGAIHESPLQNPKHKLYPAYKPSGVTWLGDIPAHWEIWKISHAYKRIGSGTTPATGDLGFYDGDIPWVTTSELRENVITDTTTKLTERAYKEYSALAMYPPGTLLIAMYGATIGRLAILGISACTNQACCAFAEPVVFEPKFAFYWLLASRPELIAESSGGGQPNINQDKLRALRIPAPPLPEQRAIAAYLDRETARLDALVAKNERLIALLQEKRTALISHAVTNGNAINKVQKDKNPAPWLFSLPSEWKRQALKHNSYMKGRIGYENLRSEEYTAEGPYLVSSVHFKDGRIDWDNCNHVTQERFEMAPEIILQEHDVLFMKDGAMMGKLAYVDNLPGDACLNTHLLLIRPMRGSYLPKFLLYLLMTDVFKSYMEVERKGTTFFGFSQESMGNYPIALPPIEEQIKICDHIVRETAKIDALVAKVRQAIERLKEYRTAQISAAVTGKMDVRETFEVSETSKV